MEIKALKCPFCEDIIFSRANHDYRSCSCGKLAVDGGFSSYGGRVIGAFDKASRATLEVDATQRELYDDWNHRKDQFGRLKEGEGNKKTKVLSVTPPEEM